MALYKKMASKRHLLRRMLFMAALVLIGCGNTAQEQKVYKIGILSGLDAFTESPL